MLQLADDIVPIGEFKTHASEVLRQMHASGRPVVITQNGRPAAVVLTPEDFDALGYRAFVKSKIKAGLKSADEGRTMSSAEVKKRLKAKRAARPVEG